MTGFIFIFVLVYSTCCETCLFGLFILKVCLFVWVLGLCLAMPEINLESTDFLDFRRGGEGGGGGGVTLIKTMELPEHWYT
jgi:hypothetical protein